MKELWLPVVGYEGFYEVSNEGRVRSLDRVTKHSMGRGTRQWKGRILKPSLSSTGYVKVNCCREGRPRFESVHRLVCRAFHGPCPSDRHNVDHVDENKRNNRVTNLRWLPMRENCRRSNPHTKLTWEDVHYIRADRRTQEQIAKTYGVSVAQISLIRSRKRWKTP